MSTTKVEINFDLNSLCPLCLGAGCLRAKRKAMQLNGPAIDYDEIFITCNMCNGSGNRMKPFRSRSTV